MRKIGIALLTFGGAALATSPAFAQEFEGGYAPRGVAAPFNAFEVGVSAGYTQGFGNIYQGPGFNTVQDVTNAALGLGLNLGWRATPAFGIGFAGQYQAMDADDRLPRDTSTRGTTAGVQADFHLIPYGRVDPWISAGAGFRSLWIAGPLEGDNISYHGFQLAKVQIGADIRASRDFAIGPFIGADLNLFVWANPENASTFNIADKGVNTFIFAGMQGRFDAGGTRAVPVPVTARR